jgi:hypothetical protein
LHFANSDKPVKLFSLDVIISVGYRVKSIQGTRFRQWANQIIKEYLYKGYCVNPRLEAIERRLDNHEKKIDFFIQSSLPPKQGIFFDGQVFDAYAFVAGLIRKATKRIVLIDNYIDDTVLTLLDKRKTDVKAMIYTGKISKVLQLDIDKHNAQYTPITIKIFSMAHDRFLIIDNDVYLIGASIKDLGKKWFGFTLMENTDADELISKLYVMA